MTTIRSPYVRDTILVDEEFNRRVATYEGGGSLYVMARVVDQREDLLVGKHPIVIVADEFLGNGHLVNAVGARSRQPGESGHDAGPTEPAQAGSPGEDGHPGGAGAPGGSVTIMCRRSSGVRIDVSGGAGAGGGNGGNGGPGRNATSIIGAPSKTTVFDAEGNPMEVEVPGEEIPVPGTLGGSGGFGGAGGAGGDAGTIRFTSILDDNPPELVAGPGQGGPGGAGGVAGPNGSSAEVPEGFDPSPVPGQPGATGADGSVTVTTLSEQEYVAALRPLLDAEGSFANHWAPYRILVGQYFYRQHRRTTPPVRPSKGELAATEFTRALELQSNNPDAQRWRDQLLSVPRPQPADEAPMWEPGGINALGLPRNLDVVPRFKVYADAVHGYGALALDFLRTGVDVLLQRQDVALWRSSLVTQQRDAESAQATTAEDRSQAETEVKLAGDAIASVQSQLDQTTRDIQQAMAAMQEESISFLGVVGTLAGLASAVVGVIAAVPSFGASLVALAPSLVALTSAALENAAPIANAVLAGEKAKTDEVKKAYEDVDDKASAVIKGAKAIVDFVDVVEKLNASATPDNSKHLALVRHGVELTHELLLARHRLTLAQQRLASASSRVARADQAVAGLIALDKSLDATSDSLRSTALHAISVAEAKADALLTLAFYAQRSVEIYTLTDQEDEVHLESGHLHPDDGRDYDEDWIGEARLVDLLTSSWSGLLDLLDLEVRFDEFTAQLHEPDQRRLSFGAGHPALESLRSTRRFSFHVDPATLPAEQVEAKVRDVRIALVGATAPTTEVTCQIRHGSAYGTRLRGGRIHVDVLQPHTSNRFAKLDRLAADEGLGPHPLLSDPQSLSFWGRGVGGDWELSIPDNEFDAGLDLSGLTEVQVWIGYQFLA